MRGILLAIALIATAAVAAAAISALQPAAYRATASWAVTVNPAAPDAASALRLLQTMARQAQLPQTVLAAAESKPLVDQAMARAGAGPGATVSVRLRAGTWVLEFAAEADSASIAAALADATGAVTDGWTRQAYPDLALSEIAPAVRPAAPVRPDVLRDGLAGALAGLAFVLGWPWLVGGAKTIRARLAGRP